MTPGSLVSFLVQRFREPAENLATASLAYILERSPACRETLRSVMTACGAELGSDLAYRGQAGGPDGAVPDLVGASPGGLPAAILEGKFWAGLTEHQPATYLRRLTPGAPGILLFVAPAQRFETLWPEVLGRCANEHAVTAPIVAQDELCSARLASGHVVAMASWRVLLDRMATAAQASADAPLAADIAQLAALCEVQDRTAFLPLQAVELSDLRTPQRQMDYYHLVLSVGQRTIAASHATGEGLRMAANEHRFGRYLHVGGWVVYLAYDADLWRAYGVGPIWLTFAEWSNALSSSASTEDATQHGVRRLLERLPSLPGGRSPVITRPDGKTIVAMRLPTHVEREEVVASVVAQIGAIADILGRYPAAVPVLDAEPLSIHPIMDGDA